MFGLIASAALGAVAGVLSTANNMHKNSLITKKNLLR